MVVVVVFEFEEHISSFVSLMLYAKMEKKELS